MGCIFRSGRPVGITTKWDSRKRSRSASAWRPISFAGISSNYPDDDLLVNTGVSFPIAFHSGEIRGVEVKAGVPRWGRFSGFVSYTNMIGTGRLPDRRRAVSR